MKIAVITAIFGRMESEKPFAPQSVPCDRFVFTEANTPIPLPNLPPRLQAKYFKLQANRIPFSSHYDVFVWIDGNIEVTSPDFVKEMVERLKPGGERVKIQKHHERQTIGEEIDFILSSKNEYLTTRYGKQPLQAEYGYYLSCGMPADAPLYSCNIFAYHIGAAALLNHWWTLVLQWSWFDQSAFSYLAWLNGGVTTIDLGPMFDNPYFKLHSHDNWNQ